MSKVIFIILIILLIGLSFILWYFHINNDKECPPPLIVYKDPPLPLDIQFSPDNYPSILYNDLFTGSNVWIGGYKYNGDQLRTDTNVQQYINNQNILALQHANEVQTNYGNLQTK